MSKVSPWIKAFRLRTLPLALANVALGSFLAAEVGLFRWEVLALAGLTILLLQILSNLANDYGDSKHGVDGEERKGPSRTVQSGEISAKAMKRAMIGFGISAFFSGLALLWVSLDPEQWPIFLGFVGLGLLCIWAAIAYTATDHPYGYAGFGDISVLAFFGFAGVLGTFFLHTGSVDWPFVLPALTCGLFSVAVLNVNNIRDIESDVKAGKYSIPVRLGRNKAVIYHWLLLASGVGCAVIYSLWQGANWYQWIFLVVLPLLWKNGQAVGKHHDPSQLDPYLKQMALTTLLFVITFGIGRIL